MPRPYPDPTRPTKTYIFDLETTGLLQRFRPDVRSDVGISELALREEARGGGYRRFTNLLRDPLLRLDADEIDARTFGEILEAKGPTGVRWQKGFRNPENVLHGVLERHVDATRAAIAGRGDLLAKESKLVSLMTRQLRQGHRIKGWNIDFDMNVMSQVAARSNPAVYQRWSRALNMARSRGQVEDMATGAKKFMFLAAQESAMTGKQTGREFFTLGQVDKKIVNLVKQGKLSVDEIEKLTYDKTMERHKGFDEFFARRLRRGGKANVSYERYVAWLRRKQSYLNRPDVFAMGQKFPDIGKTKGWSADILKGALAPEGIKGSTLERRALEISKRFDMVSHEALSDTVYEELLDRIFRTRSRTWAGTWKEIAPRLKEYGIHSQEEFFNRYRSSIERKAKSQLKEHALESTRKLDNRWQTALTNKLRAFSTPHKEIAGASRSQPETLRKIYSRAYGEVSGKWRMFKTANPKLAMAAQVLAGAAIVDYLIPDKDPPTKGVREADVPYRNIDGISFGPTGRGVARALTDYGTGRHLFNPTTTGFSELSAYRSSLWIRYPDRYGIDFHTLEKNYETWTSARSASARDLFTREDYTTVKGARSKVRGLNRDAWVGILDLDKYKIKVEDADTVTAHRKGIVGMFRKPVSIRLAGIDAPEVEHGGIAGRLVEDQFAGKQATEYLEQLIERQQSLRLVVDPSSRSYNRHMGVLIGDRRANLNLQMVRAGAAAALPWNKRTIVDNNVFAEAEAQAAAGGLGMWQSKGWQMHRALGLIAGERVTNTTLTQLKRITKSNSLMAWYGLVQNAHDDKSRWAPQEMERMYQVGAAYRAEVTGAINKRTAEIGPLPALRKPVNPWQLAGRGIRPSSLQYGNVSDFGSGRSVLNKEQLLRLPQGNDAMSQALRKTGLLEKEFNWLTRKGGRRDITNLYRAAGALRPFEERLLRDTPYAGWKGIGVTNLLGEILDRTRTFSEATGGPAVSSEIRSKFGQVVKHARRLQARGMWDANIMDLISHGREGEASQMVEYVLDGLQSFERFDSKQLHRRAAVERMQGARPRPALSPKMQRRLWHGQLVHEENRARNLLMRRASHRPPRIAQPEFLEGIIQPRPGEPPLSQIMRAPEKRISAKAVHAPRVPKVVKEVIEEVPEIVKRPAVKPSSARAMASGRGGLRTALGVGAVAAATGLAIGAWSLLRGKNEEDARAMAGMRTYSPGEFVGMKSHAPFYSSSKAAAWAEHQMMRDPARQAQEPSKFMKIVRMLPWLLNPFKELSASPAMEAWDYFYSGRAGFSLTKDAELRLYKGLKKQGFSENAIEAWFRKTKATEGFGVKIQKDVFGKSAIDKIWDKWDAVKKWPGRLMDVMDQKKSKLGKDFSNRVNDWFKNLNTKFKAKAHGVDSATLNTLIKEGRLKELAPSKQVYHWARQKDNFKYIWKHLFKDAGSYGAKIDAARQIAGNLGNLEQMRMSIQAGLIKQAPANLLKKKNLFYSVGNRLNKYIRQSKWFSGKFPKAAKNIKKMGLSLKMSSATKAGRVLGKLPYVNAVFGIMEGLEMMDQYESATKGFMIEAAAGTAGSVIETAIMGSVVTAAKVGFATGFAIGEAIFPPGGGIIGGIIGGVLGVVGTLAAGLIAGQVVRAGVRGAGRLALGARMKRTIDPAAYQGPDSLYPVAHPWMSMRQNDPRTFTKFHAMDPARPDMTPFGGAYNPIQGQDIDTRTLQIANNRRRITAKPMAPRPISMFTPTFGLVNKVLWDKRRGSKIRSVVERGASRHRSPKRSRNASRMLAHAA